MNRNTAGIVLQSFGNDTRAIRNFSKLMMRMGVNKRIKQNAAKRVINVRVSDLIRRRRAQLLEWAHKFNKNELQRLVNLPNNNAYSRRVNSIPNPPLSRVQVMKAVIAKYLINANLNWPNAVHGVRRIHNAYGRPVQNRIPNAQLVNFVMRLPTSTIYQFHNNLPYYV